MPNNYSIKSYKWKTLKRTSDSIPEDSTRVDTTIQTEDTIISPEDTIRDTSQTIIYEHDSIKKAQDTSLTDSSISSEQESRGEQTYQPPPSEIPQKPKFDTISELYNIFNVTELPISKRMEKDPSAINFLYNIPVYAPVDTPKKEILISQSSEQKIKENITDREIKIAETNSVDWYTWLLLGLFLMIGWSRLFFKKYFSLLLKSIFFHNYAEDLYYDKNSLITRVSMILNLNYFLILGVFGYQIYDFTNPAVLENQNSLLLTALFSSFFIVWYIWNAFFTSLVGNLFNLRETYNKYLYNYNLHRKIIGIIVFPLAVLIQFINPEYQKSFFIAGIVLTAFLYFIHIIRGLQIFLKDNVSLFHLILYLCALEFLPLIVLFDALAEEI
ncbi:MAG: DUF4271 domain-containing protein [Bacteroidales bacterium]